MILIVDDDASIVASLALLLKQAGFASITASSPDEALRCFARESISLVLQDMNFSRQTTGEEGLKLLGDIKNIRPKLPVILITAWGSIPLAVRGIQNGAADFITKPWTKQQLLQSVKTALDLADASLRDDASHSSSRDDIDEKYDFNRIIGADPQLLRTLEVLGRVSATDASVLITGESGTGKEIIAEAVHRNSRRSRGPFVKVNLGGISSALFESEMFGHVKGAFTDARQNRKGRMELADGGTIFLDEIGDLLLSSQVKMLRVLQDRTYEVLGSSMTRTVDVRDDVRRQQHAGRGAQDDADERHQGTERARAPSRHGGEEGDHHDPDVQSLRRCHRAPSPTRAIASSSSSTLRSSQGCAQPATSSIAEMTWPVKPHTNMWLSRKAGPA